MKNIDKWNILHKILDDKVTEFLEEQNIKIPQTFYKVDSKGIINTCTLEIITYSWKIPYVDFKSKVTGIMLKQLQSVVDQNTPLKVENLKINFKQGLGYTYTIWYNHFFEKKLNSNTYWNTLEEANIQSKKIIDYNIEVETFYTLHKKDLSYNYEANGYKFLGWQNEWEYIRLGEEQGLTPNPEKYPEYTKCKEQHHRTIEVSRGDRGYENIVSCPLCKIYWKYDCSD